MADVFISYYKETAGAVAQQVRTALEEAGISCWHDEQSAMVDAEQIMQAIQDCKVFLLILEEGAVASTHVQKEVRLAYTRLTAHGPISILSFRVDRCVLDNDMRHWLMDATEIGNGGPPGPDQIREVVRQVSVLSGRSRPRSVWPFGLGGKKELKKGVFISYHRATARGIVQKIADALAKAKISYWYDEENVDAGHYAEEIVRAIDQCRVFLLILEEGANASDDVLHEVHLAFDRLKKGEDIQILPFKTDACGIRDGLRYYLAGLDRIDLGHAPDADEIRRLVERVERLLGR